MSGDKFMIVLMSYNFDSVEYFIHRFGLKSQLDEKSKDYVNLDTTKSEIISASLTRKWQHEINSGAIWKVVNVFYSQ